MPKVPEPDKRVIITRAPFVDESVGEMVAHLLHGNAEIDVHVDPFESDQHAKFGMTVEEARQLAAALLQITDAAQAAMWTPELLAHVRTHYLPGATDAEIIARLNDLAERQGGGIELRPGGRLFHADGQALTAAAHRDKIDRVSEAMSTARVSLTELESVVGELRIIYAEPDHQ